MNVGRFPDGRPSSAARALFTAATATSTGSPDDPTLLRAAAGRRRLRPARPALGRERPEVSVSLSITFRTPVTERGAIVHSVNRRLRKLRITPRPPGEHLGTDKAKFALHRGFKTLSRR